jgi:hypothetical protein
MARKRGKNRARRITQILYFEDDAPTAPMPLTDLGLQTTEDFDQCDTIPGLTWSDLQKPLLH